ncbi:MAG: hypothetical protein JXE07_07595 [Candidatus Aminicenantes bacterium]|nr:hypothetical protein [Candidatus Aminicenantes bacterium]
MNFVSDRIRQLWMVAAGVSLLLIPVRLFGEQESTLLSKEGVRRFLLTAEVIKSEEIGKGLTHPWRLTLTDGDMTHDASFQDVNIRTREAGFAGGGREINFADSYHYNIASYELARLLGIDDMVPVTVEREWQGKKGSLSWWVDVKMDEEERLTKGLLPPDTHAWNIQMHKVFLFSQLIYDTDRNVQNILISEDWKIWIIDFTRAYRTVRKLQDEKMLIKCERTLLERLRALARDDVTRAVGNHLTKWEIDALLARRELIVSRFDTLIAEKGESRVLY